MKSHLQAGDELLSKAIAAAPLGDNYERKNRGRRQELTPGMGGVRLLDIVGDDQLAQHLTVHGSMGPVGSYTPDTRGRLPRVVLFASWGTDGAAHQAEIDLVQGACFSVAASSLRVDAQIEVPIEDESQIPVICSLSVGYYPSPGRAQRTYRRVAAAFDPDVPLASAIDVPVPPFAARLQVLRGGPSASSAPVAVAIFDGSGAGGLLLASVSTAFDVDMPLPNGAAHVIVSNLSGAPIPVQAVYELRL